MKSSHILQTGQHVCFDVSGKQIPCVGTGQDGEFRMGTPWPPDRFELADLMVIDRLTGLSWTRDANLAEYPLTWQESLDFIKEMNNTRELGYDDWRLPNRHELRSLMDYQAKKPALPAVHCFVNVFLGWYWTSTTAAIDPRYAWYIHMEGARMFYGRKDQYYLLWPVRGEGVNLLPRTGQAGCFDANGKPIDCQGSGQDAEFGKGASWPEPRFEVQGEIVLDCLTGLGWLKEANLTHEPVSWQEALDAVTHMNATQVGGLSSWQLPNINALASLVDCSNAKPALPNHYPFRNVKDVYWSSTTSYFETDWAWALYMDKGATGVGFKTGKTFHVWPVCLL